MAYLHYLLFVFLCMASVAMAARGKQFPSCNRGCWSKIMKCNLFSRCLCDHADRQDPGNCRCCNNCKSCLGNMWNYCCGCLKMCPPPDPTVPSDVYMSTAGDLKEFIPSLFEALSYGSNLPFKFANHRPSRKTHVGANVTKRVDKLSTPVTCKVGFFHHCMATLDRCQRACQELGSSRYRYFHIGCCECIGDTCTDYGKTKPRCKRCPK